MKLRTKFVLALLVLVGIYLLAGFFLAPFIVRSQLHKRLPPVLDRTVTLETVRINPLTLVIELEDFAVQDPDGTGFVSFDGIRIDLQASSIFRSGFTFKEILLDGPAIEIKREPDGTLNFADLLAKGAGQEAEVPDGDAEEALPAIRVGRLVVESGSFSVEDLSPRTHYRKEVGNISFTAEELRTDSEEAGRFNIFGESGQAESFRLSGQIVPNPLHIQGVLVMEALDLTHFMPYAESLLNGQLDGGTLDVKMAYGIRPGGDDPEMRIYDGFIELDDFSFLINGTDNPAVEWTRFAVSNASVDLLEATVEIEEVALNGASVLAHRREDGILNLATAYAGDDPGTAGEAPARDAAGESKAARDWALSIGRVEILDTILSFLDESLPKPARIALLVPKTEVTDLSIGDPSPYSLVVNLANEAGGTGLIEGKGTLLPLDGSYSLTLERWDLTPIDPFLSAMTDFNLLNGYLGVDGEIAFTREASGFTGDLSFETIQVFNPNLELVLRENPSTDPGQDPGEEPGTTEEPAVSETEDAVSGPVGARDPSFDMAVDSFSIVDGTFTFEDLRQDPVVVFSAVEIGTQIQGLSSDSSARPTFSLDAHLMEVTPLSASGQLNVLARPFADIQVDLNGLEMTPFGPYFSRYVGYHLEKGLLNLDLHYLLEDGELDAKNVVVLNQLTLGGKTDSPDATGLPVPLAVSLLKDPAGNIEVDLPIQGRLDDPQFRIGKVVLRGLSTLILKAASSPFNLLAGLVNAESENLDRISFAPGSSELSAAAEAQLDSLAQAMEKRPAIGLDLVADIDPSIETPALKMRVLKEDIVANVEIEDPDSLSEAEAYQARLGKAYRSNKALSFLSPKLPPIKEMEDFLTERIDVAEEDLIQLAAGRKQAVRNYLVKKDGIEPDRVLIQSDTAVEKRASGSSQVRFSIR